MGFRNLQEKLEKEHYSNFCTFEIASFVNVPGYYLRKFGKLKIVSIIACEVPEFELKVGFDPTIN